jgi:hypothetical protein
MRRYLVERDVSKLSAAHQAGLAQTQQKLSDAADAVAASSGRARTLPAIGTAELLEEMLDVGLDFSNNLTRAEGQGVTAAMQVIGSEDVARMREEAIAKGRM